MANLMNKLFGNGDDGNGAATASGVAPIHVTDQEFEDRVLGSELPVLVDFWAPWCMPCRMLSPILEKLAPEFDGKAMIAKVNTDENPEWAIKYGVQGIPTMLFVKDGQVVDRLVGVAPVGKIKQQLEQLL